MFLMFISDSDHAINSTLVCIVFELICVVITSSIRTFIRHKDRQYKIETRDNYGITTLVSISFVIYSLA